MIIDEKGKLFGKINIIDLVVIILVIAAVGVAAYAKLSDRGAEPKEGDQTTLVMKYYIEEVNDFVADKVIVGVPLFDDSTITPLGTVTAVERKPSVSFAPNSQGEFVRSPKEGFSSLIITGEVKGKKTEHGAEVNKVKYGVGHTFVLRAGDAKLYLRVYDIQVK
jgi:hypothetical protein